MWHFGHRFAQIEKGSRSAG